MRFLHQHRRVVNIDSSRQLTRGNELSRAFLDDLLRLALSVDRLNLRKLRR